MNCAAIDFLEISEDLLNQGICLRFRCRGNSMHPFIQSGDILYVKKTGMEDIKYADIVCYRDQDDRIVIHRVLKKQRQGAAILLTTKGDSSAESMERVNGQRVLGKVVAAEKDRKAVPIDRGFQRLFSMIYARFLPLSRWSYRASFLAFRTVRGSLRCEEALILSCCRVEASPQRLAQMLSQGMDEAYFLKRAGQERIAGLIFKTLSEMEERKRSLLPQTMDLFRNSYEATLGENVLSERTAKDILRELGSAGIKALIFKGPVLARFVYEDLGVRPMVDIDMLIRQEDFKRADEILRNLGYLPPFKIGDLSLIMAHAYHNSLLYQKSRGWPRFIHVYWHLLNLFPYDENILKKFNMEKIWQAAGIVRFDDVTAWRLSPVHEVIYLCLHAFNHAFTPFILLCDIDRFVRSQGGRLDWDRLVGESFSLGLWKFVYHGLYLAERLLGTEVPQGCLNRLKPKKISLFERKLIRAALHLAPPGRRPSMGLVYLGMNETWARRGRFLCRSLFPTKEEMAIIRQKPPSQVTAADYLQRIFSGLRPS